MTAILRFALPATIYWLHGGLMQHLLLPVNIQLSKNSMTYQSSARAGMRRLLIPERFYGGPG